MQGYYQDDTGYLTHNGNHDQALAIALTILSVLAGTIITMYLIVHANADSVWEGDKRSVSMPDGVIWYLMLVPFSSYYTVQISRMTYRYILGYEHWISPYSIDPLSFQIHPAADLVKGIFLSCFVLVGVAVGTLSMKFPTSYTVGLATFYTTTTVLIVSVVLIPSIIMTMQYIRRVRLRKLETYRRLGGE